MMIIIKALFKRTYSGECVGNRPAERQKENIVWEKLMSFTESRRKVHNKFELRSFKRSNIIVSLMWGSSYRR